LEATAPIKAAKFLLMAAENDPLPETLYWFSLQNCNAQVLETKVLCSKHQEMLTQ
jgi:hypothetical protein